MKAEKMTYDILTEHLTGVGEFLIKLDNGKHQQFETDGEVCRRAARIINELIKKLEYVKLVDPGLYGAMEQEFKSDAD